MRGLIERREPARGRDAMGTDVCKADTAIVTEPTELLLTKPERGRPASRSLSPWRVLTPFYPKLEAPARPLEPGTPNVSPIRLTAVTRSQDSAKNVARRSSSPAQGDTANMAYAPKLARTRMHDPAE